MIALHTELTHLVVHHSASKRSVTFGEVRSWHLDNGWDTIGYHYLVEEDGRLYYGRHPWQVGAHVGGKNTGKLGICLVGDNTQEGEEWTGPQIDTMRQFIAASRLIWHSIFVVGHNELADTLCPGLDLSEVL